MTLAEMKTNLAALEAQALNPAEYNIVGSHSVKNSNQADIQNQIALLKKRIFRFQGYTGRTTPDFSTGSNKDAKDYL